MSLLTRYIIIPIAAYFAMMITVAIIGTVDKNFIRETLDNNAMPVWIVWMGILFVITTIHWSYSKWRNR